MPTAPGRCSRSARPRPMVTVDAGKLQSFARADDSPGATRSLLLVAALAGLGRITPDQAAQAGLRLGDSDPWTDAIDAATRDRAPGTIALLAGVGMQTRNWTGGCRPPTSTGSCGRCAPSAWTMKPE